MALPSKQYAHNGMMRVRVPPRVPLTKEDNMSLDKAIEHGNEHRKPYYRSKNFDLSCRNHGGCPTCFGNRMHKNIKNLMNAEDTKNE